MGSWIVTVGARALPAALVAVSLLSGCAVVVAAPEREVTSGVAPTAAPGGDTPAGDSAAAPDERLAGLLTRPRRTPAEAGYVRSAFGSAWADVDHNGCNQRDDVLRRDAVAGTLVVGVQGRCDHDVLAGSWIDPYTGSRLDLDDLKDRRQAQAVQIDHVVPLAEAWVSGASEWTAERRRLFANDLDVLLAVDGPANASKGSGDPAAWRPRRSYQCEYARRWITVKSTWGLAVDQSERAALETMLDYC